MISINTTLQYKIRSVTIFEDWSCVAEISELSGGNELRRLTVEASPAETINYLPEETLAEMAKAAYRLVADKLQLPME